LWILGDCKFIPVILSHTGNCKLNRKRNTERTFFVFIDSSPTQLYADCHAYKNNRRFPSTACGRLLGNIRNLRVVSPLFHLPTCRRSYQTRNRSYRARGNPHGIPWGQNLLKRDTIPNSNASFLRGGPGNSTNFDLHGNTQRGSYDRHHDIHRHPSTIQRFVRTIRTKGTPKPLLARLFDHYRLGVFLHGNFRRYHSRRKPLAAW